MKPKRSLAKAKAKGTKLDKQIATARAIEEKERLALTCGRQPKTPAQAVVFAWKAAAWCEQNPHVMKPSKKLTDFGVLVANLTGAYIDRALREWKPEMLSELAREMKRFPKKWQPDTGRWCLIVASEEGAVNLSELQRVAEQRRIAFQDYKTYQRSAKGMEIPTRSAGQPRKY